MDERLGALQGGIRPWWDVEEQRLIDAAVLYLPQGCPDWGETRGKRNQLCSFCSLPYAASNYRLAFYGSENPLSQNEYLRLFTENFKLLVPSGSDIHTLMIFNAGSFMANEANSPETRDAIARQVADHPDIRRLVVESRASLITEEALRRMMSILGPAGKRLTIRIGIETQDDYLRFKVLKKGHSRRELGSAMDMIKKYGVNSGGYVLLNSAPLSEMRNAMKRPEADREEIMRWAMEETWTTLEWILGNGSGGLDLDEAYFCSTNVGPGTALTRAWEKGEFSPASLWMVYEVLQRALTKFSGRVHLLPFKDEPELLSVPSNHVLGGIPQDLSGAQGCDLEFHRMLGRYRETLDPRVLIPPVCGCRPDWMT